MIEMVKTRKQQLEERRVNMDRFDFQKEFVELMDKAISQLPPSEFDRFMKRIEEELEEYKD